MSSQPSITCPFCKRVSYHPEDVRHRYCGACHRFHDDELPNRGTSRPDDTYCSKCDVFGHATGSPACEFYYARWEKTDGNSKDNHH